MKHETISISARPGPASTVPEGAAVGRVREEAEPAPGKLTQITPRVRLRTRQGRTAVAFETQNTAVASPWIHINYLTHLDAET